MRNIFSFLLSLTTFLSTAQKHSVTPPLPAKMHLEWSALDYYFFVHFGPNTFTNLEWGEGTEHEEIFNPTQLDCRQWCRIAKAAGAKGIIITAKHHDGFCLWPSAYSKHTVRESKWRNGEGDVLKELSEACKEYDLKLGIYLSPWDRNHPKYGTEDYNDVFVDMMKEVVNNYGPLFEFWWDGANGEGPNGKKQVYDWQRFEQTLRTIAPNTPVFSDIGPDIRWVGNEKGIAGKTNWNLLDTSGFTRGEGSPHVDTLNKGNENGRHWIPAECDVSIRPGWFYHAEEDDKVKSPEQLFDLYLKSVGRGANLLLNVPPDGRGLINEHDSIALIGFKELREKSFKKNLAKSAKASYQLRNNKKLANNLNDDNNNTYESIVSTDLSTVDITFQKPEQINCIVLKEYLNDGQKCKKFRLKIMNDKHHVIKEIDGTTIGKSRIITFPSVIAKTITLKVEEQKAATCISEIQAFLIDEHLIEKN